MNQRMTRTSAHAPRSVRKASAGLARLDDKGTEYHTESVPVHLGKFDGSENEADPIPDGSASGTGDTNYALPPNAGDDEDRAKGSDPGSDGLDYLLPFPASPMPNTPGVPTPAQPKPEDDAADDE